MGLQENQKEISPIVFIDDDEFWRGVWDFGAHEQGVKITTYGPNVSIEELLNYPKDTFFYLDQELGSQQLGVHYAERLYEHGYRNLVLCTCHDSSLLKSKYPWLLGVRGKSPPWFE